MFFFVLIFVEKIVIRDGLRNQTITNFGSKQKKVVKSRRSKIKRLKIWNSSKWSDKSFSCQLNNFTKKLWNLFCGKKSWKHNGFRLFNCWQLRFDKKKFENYENYFVGKNRKKSWKFAKMSLNLASFANFGGDEDNIASSSDAPEELPIGIRVKNEFAESEETANLRTMGLPTSFGLETATVKKGEKQSFYCDLCFVELNR